MKLKDLNEQARRQNFDMRRIQRIHSSLYRLASSSGNEPIYFTSKWGALYGYLYGLDDARISGLWGNPWLAAASRSYLGSMVGGTPTLLEGF